MQTASGAFVDPETAMTYGAVFASVRILSETIASLPLFVYERLETGKRRAAEHALYAVLHDMANPEMTAYDLREVMMTHVLLWGNAYAEIEINGAGQVAALWPLRPDKMTVKRGEDGALKYHYQLPASVGGGVKVFAAWQILHLKGPSKDGVMGMSMIAAARESIGLGMRAEEFGARFFANDATPGLVMIHPEQLSDEAYGRMKDSWNAAHQGAENSHRMAILEEGVKIERIGIAPGDAQYLETRKFQVTEVARIFRLPPHMLADLERATFSNIEHQGLEFVTYSLMPWLVRFEQRMALSLLLPGERKKYYVKHLVEGLLRGDIKTRYEAYSIGRNGGWLCANDIRELEDMNAVEGGDIYLVPLNMVPVESLLNPEPVLVTKDASPDKPDTAGPDAAEPDAAEPDSQRALSGAGEVRWERMSAEMRAVRSKKSAQSRQRLMKSYRKVWLDTAETITRREVHDIREGARKIFGTRDAGQFSVWLERYYQELADYARRKAVPLSTGLAAAISMSAAEEVGGEADEAAVERFARAYASAFASRHSQVDEERLREVVKRAIEKNQDPLAEIEAELDSWESEHPEAMAQNETNRLTNAVTKLVYTACGIRMLMWWTFGDACEYCSGLNGVVVGVDEAFIGKGEGGLAPGTTIGHPPAHRGCDCLIGAA
jgi:HK97 family phage portal protein